MGRRPTRLADDIGERTEQFEAWQADRYDRVRMFRRCTWLFAATAVLCGVGTWFMFDLASVLMLGMMDLLSLAASAWCCRRWLQSRAEHDRIAVILLRRKAILESLYRTGRWPREPRKSGRSAV